MAVALPLAPRTRGDCAPGGPLHQRPCPWARECRYGLDDGACALDVADAGGATLAEVGALMHVTGERVRVIESKALARLRRVAEGRGLSFASLAPADRGEVEDGEEGDE